MLNRIELKQNAKVITKSARVSAYQMTLLYLVIRFALSLADNYVSADNGTWVQIGDMQFQVQSLFHHAAFPTPVVVFVSVLVWLLGCVLAPIAGIIPSAATRVCAGVRKCPSPPCLTGSVSWERSCC